MSLNTEEFLSYKLAPSVERVSATEAALYALAIGAANEPADHRARAMVYENHLRIFPTMPVILGMDMKWMDEPAFGLDQTQLLHVDQSIRIHAPISVDEPLTVQNGLVDIVDKGPKRGAFISANRLVHDAKGRLAAEITGSYLYRNNGGFGGVTSPSKPERAVPERAADIVFETHVSRTAAALYRLTGDRNPLHIEPEFAKAAGFERPILHGLCTFASVAAGFVKAACALDIDRLRYFRCRFSAPVYPGDWLLTEVWRGESDWQFRTSVIDRSGLVLSAGIAETS